jgi:hypothetical protein
VRAPGFRLPTNGEGGSWGFYNGKGGKMNKFKTGDVVKLVSGGVPMSVVYTEGKETERIRLDFIDKGFASLSQKLVFVEWHDKNGCPHLESYPETILKLCEVVG